MKNTVIVGLLCIGHMSLVMADDLILQNGPIIQPLNQELIDIEINQRDAEIIKSMDDLGDQLDLIELDKQQNVLLPERLKESSIDFIDAKELQRIDSDILLDEGFDELDIDMELFDDTKEPNRFAKESSNNMIKIRGLSTKNKTINGVGVKGTEEYIINKLDESDLINVESELEMLMEELEMISKQPSDIDDF
jgi:hypothetical protein